MLGDWFDAVCVAGILICGFLAGLIAVSCILHMLGF